MEIAKMIKSHVLCSWECSISCIVRVRCKFVCLEHMLCTFKHCNFCSGSAVQRVKWVINSFISFSRGFMQMSLAIHKVSDSYLHLHFKQYKCTHLIWSHPLLRHFPDHVLWLSPSPLSGVLWFAYRVKYVLGDLQLIRGR